MPHATTADGVKLLRVPFDGGSELSILFASTLRLSPIPIAGSAVGPDGRIAVTVTSPDTMFRGVALLDPVTAVLERLPVVFDGDLQYPAWNRDGSLRAVGVPGFNPIQEYKDYDVRMHHTNVDLYERVREQDLKQNAVVLAWFAWQAANTAERLPRP